MFGEESPMRACPNCGTQLAADAEACFICGTALGDPSERHCPACGRRYGTDYADNFCGCGVELKGTSDSPAAAKAVERPPAGTRCLVLYGSDRRPLHYFPLTRDVTLIGRLDPVQGSFPDINVDAFVPPALARKVSRRHALVLHTRADDSFHLRPLEGNTGTQIEADMVLPQVDYALAPGTRFVLGGGLRFKFEIT
jgi:hypothetical protein